MCARPSKSGSDLNADEHTAGARTHLELLALHRPQIVCFVGLDIWNKFISQLKATGSIPTTHGSAGGRVKKGSASKASSSLNENNGNKTVRSLKGKSKGSIKLGPEDSLKAFKIVHRDVTPHRGSNILPEPDTDSMPVSPDRLEADTDVEEAHDFDPSKSQLLDGILRQSETLFFVMPNTSGLVAGCKPAQYAEFIVALKQLVMEARAGLVNTDGFVEIVSVPHIQI